ncbi:MAG: helix-turn-helix domain-containing protein [Pseudomonadota bacterium]|jgi:transposase
MGRKSETSVEKRVEHVMALLRKEEPATQIARRAGVSEQTLYRWREEFVAGGKAQLAGKGAEAQASTEMSKLQREIETREQVIGELTIANRILKKLSGPSL